MVAKVTHRYVNVQNVLLACILASYFRSMKRNVPLLGFVIGMILPAMGILLFGLITSRNGGGLGGFFQNMIHNPKMASKIITLSLLLELIPFIYYTNKRLDYTARGILIATVLYALFTIWIMFIL